MPTIPPRNKDQEPPDLLGKLAVVVGMGTSGRAAAELLGARGARVIVNDRASGEALGDRAAPFSKLDVEVVVGTHQGDFWVDADLVVLSPGVPSFPELALATRAEIIGETELASRYLTAPLLAIGGTNGKSTVTTLVGHIVEAAGLRAFVGGNLGEPACDAPGQAPDVVVLEVSSFQMERVVTFRPKVAVLLNVTEDHLDRYTSFDDYADAKGNCFLRQDQTDFAVAPMGDARARAQVERGGGTVVTFGEGGDFRVEGQAVLEVATGQLYDLSEADLHGRHNHENAAAAIAVCRSFGVTPEHVSEGLRRFRALPHRMALVVRSEGVNYYDDSKATNVGAAVMALRGLSEPRGVLIAGGRDKLGSYDELVAALAEKGRAVVLLGEAKARLAAAVGDALPVVFADTIEAAVILAQRLARPGDAVLLSPACSSLDMFKSYAERGDRFARAASTLAKKGPSS